MARLKESEVIDLVSVIHNVTEEERANILKKLLKTYGGLLKTERERFTYLVEEEELEAEERALLIEATKYFNLDKGATFTTFLRNTVHFGLLDFVNSYGLIHYSRNDRRMITEINRAKEELEEKKPGEIINEYAISEHLGHVYSINAISLALANKELVLSGDMSLSDDSPSLIEQYGEYDEYELDDEADLFNSLIENADLTYAELVVFSDLWHNDISVKNNKELKEKLNVTPSRLSQIRKSALRKIRIANKGKKK